MGQLAAQRDGDPTIGVTPRTVNTRWRMHPIWLSLRSACPQVVRAAWNWHKAHPAPALVRVTEVGLSSVSRWSPAEAPGRAREWSRVPAGAPDAWRCGKRDPTGTVGMNVAVRVGAIRPGFAVRSGSLSVGELSTAEVQSGRTGATWRNKAVNQRAPNIVTSGLSRTVQRDGIPVQVNIYRLEDELGWALEVVNAKGTSTVWDEHFETDDAANAEFLATVDGSMSPMGRISGLL